MNFNLLAFLLCVTSIYASINKRSIERRALPWDQKHTNEYNEIYATSPKLAEFYSVFLVEKFQTSYLQASKESGLSHGNLKGWLNTVRAIHAVMKSKRYDVSSRSSDGTVTKNLTGVDRKLWESFWKLFEETERQYLKITAEPNYTPNQSWESTVNDFRQFAKAFKCNPFDQGTTEFVLYNPKNEPNDVSIGKLIAVGICSFVFLAPANI